MKRHNPIGPSDLQMRLGLMTNLEPEFASSTSSKEAAIGLAFGLDVPELPAANGPRTEMGSLVSGSSATPIAVFAMTIGKRSFFALLNPLDSSLRPHMQRQHDSARLPLAVMNASGQVLRGVCKQPVFGHALKDTMGKAPCDGVAWFDHALQMTPAIVATYADANPDFASCEEHNVYIIAPYEPGHRLA